MIQSLNDSMIQFTLVRHVLGSTGEQLDGMRHQLYDRLQGLDCARRTSWKVQDDRRPANTTQPAAQDCKWSFLLAFSPHPFGDTVQHSATHGARGFGRDIAGGNSCA